MSTWPTRVVIIAASPRTGSNLLCRGLSAAGVVGDAREYLGPLVESVQRGELPWRHVRARGVLRRLRRRLRGDANWRSTRSVHLRRRVLVSHLRRSALEHSASNGTYAIKVMWGHYGGTMLPSGVDASIWGVPVIWIHLRRNDTLAQAVSWLRAEQSKRWIAGPDDGSPVEFDRARILALEEQARREEAAWQQYFADADLSPITVVYEDLLDGYEATMRRVLDALGHPEVAVAPPQTVRQADAQSEEWIRRVRESSST